MSLKIISYNVNGIRSAISKGLTDWIATHQFDIICLQETKAQPGQADITPLLSMGYRDFWHSAEKKGYSGVLTLSKINPDNVELGCGNEEYDREGRVLRTDFGEWTLLNCYYPSGTTGEVRQAVKMRFLRDFYDWVQELKKSRPRLVVVGDYNIAHQEIDIHDPKGNKNSSGFLPEERAWMTQWLAGGFTDTFRHMHPGKVEYSWWSFRAGSRSNNKGWRIDYQTVTDNLRDKIRAAGHYNEAQHSDHCPVFLELDI